MTTRNLFLQVCLIGLLLTAPAYAAAQEVMARSHPYWPSERAERLEEIGERVKDLLQQSSRAVYFGRLEEQEQILRQMTELQREAERLREAPVQTSAVQ
jgi:hypothetical protein